MQYHKTPVEDVFAAISNALSFHIFDVEVRMLSRFDVECWTLNRCGDKTPHDENKSGAPGILGMIKWWFEDAIFLQGFSVHHTDAKSFARDIVREYGGSGQNDDDFVRVCTFLNEENDPLFIVGITDKAQAMLFKLKH